MPKQTPKGKAGMPEKRNPPEIQRLVDEMNKGFSEIEKIRTNCLQEAFKVPECNENLKKFKSLRSHFLRESRELQATNSLLARIKVERIYAKMTAMCAGMPELRAHLRLFKKQYSDYIKLFKTRKAK